MCVCVGGVASLIAARVLSGDAGEEEDNIGAGPAHAGSGSLKEMASALSQVSDSHTL